MVQITYKFIFVLIISILIGCHTEKIVKQVVTEEQKEKNRIKSEKMKLAMDKFLLGTAAEAKGDYAGAILEFQEAMALDPNPGIYYSLAKNYFILNKLSLAIQYSRKAVEFENKNIDYLILLEEIYTASKLNDSAISTIEKIIGIDSANVNSYYKLARLYELNRPRKAIEVYNKITKLIGNDWNVLLHVAELYDRLGDSQNSILTIENLLKLDPSNLPIQKLLIEFYLKNKNYDKALISINELIHIYPDDIELRERKAQIFIEQENWKDASKEYQFILKQPIIPFEAKIRIGASFFNAAFKDSSLISFTKEIFETIDKDTTDWQVKMFLGAVALKEKKDSAAAMYFQKVTELAPYNAEGWVRLGGIYFDNGKYDEAIKVLDKAVEKFPDDFAINFILGISFGQKREHSSAIKYLKKAVQLNPTDIPALSSLGYSLNQNKQNPEAIYYLKQALELDKDNIDLLGTLGLIYDTIEDWKNCDSIYSIALKHDSLNATINNNYAYSLSKREIKLDEALIMIEIAIKAEPNNSAFLDTYGWIYFKLKNYDSAKIYIEKAVKIGGDRPVILEHLGDVIFMLGKKEEAVNIWKKSFELDKNNSVLKLKIERGTL